MTDSTNGIIPPSQAPIDKLAARIAALTAERDQYVQQANQTVGVYNGRIAEAQDMLNELQKEQNRLNELRRSLEIVATDHPDDDVFVGNDGKIIAIEKANHNDSPSAIAWRENNDNKP